MLTLKNIKKSFPGVFTPVLNGIDLSLADGDFCTVIGANGSGKSTLFKVINGEYIPDSGTIAAQSQIAQVVQDVNHGTIPEMTLLENIALSLIKKPKLTFYSQFRKKIIEQLKILDIGLEEYIDQPLKYLSGGQRQVIATLMAINSGCKILLLDEHTSALDPKMEVLLMEYTAKQIAKLELTTIMITHKIDDALKYGNRLIMLHKGKIVLDVFGDNKKSLDTTYLLSLFHQYEDSNLTSGGKCDY